MTELRDLFDEDFEIQTMNVSFNVVLQARKSTRCATSRDCPPRFDQGHT
jgi:hypothetical protein